MWIRWALLIALVYILYRLFRPARTRSVPKGGPSDAPEEEVMVQDPSCRAFLPRSQALEFRSGGEVIYFCSAECRDRYLKGERN